MTVTSNVEIIAIPVRPFLVEHLGTGNLENVQSDADNPDNNCNPNQDHMIERERRFSNCSSNSEESVLVTVKHSENDKQVLEFLSEEFLDIGLKDSPQLLTTNKDNLEDRLKTFYNNWPDSALIKPLDLSKAGFLVKRPNQSVICFWCFKSVNIDYIIGDVWKLHAKLSGFDCEFLLKEKGREFIENANKIEKFETKVEIMEEKINENGVDSTTEQNERVDENDKKEIVIEQENLNHCVESTSKGKNESTLKRRRNKKRKNRKKKKMANLKEKLEKSVQLEEEKKKCKKCHTNDRTTIFLPCSELIYCSKCAENIDVCPQCGEEIQSKNVVYPC
ncbi:DgyrCDS3310 [Dimorphilus gyrociliatus]|uniref:DgyrCDS3310 n=1 Tax=Dimorphilus gyrociliatus TaxID=2664684 RepID=A0A7I8VEQ8_9ANNE|nr:DgyrCDS3310 [Dimorphilus gyrociliatus]